MRISKEDQAKVGDASIRTLCGRVDGGVALLPAVELAYELQRAVYDVGGRWFAIPDVRETREYVPVRSEPADSEGKDQHLVGTKLVSAPKGLKADTGTMFHPEVAVCKCAWFRAGRKAWD